MKDEELRLSTLQLSAQILGSDSKDLDRLFDTSNKLLTYINGNWKLPNVVKKPDTKFVPTPENLIEIQECLQDPINFIKKCRVQHPTKGAIFMDLYPFQEKMINHFESNRFAITMVARQMGKTTVAGMYLLWKAMFSPDQTILIISNKYVQAQEIMDRIRFTYENLPDHLRAGVVNYNKNCISFNNGSKIIVRACCPDAGRGLVINLLYVDEAAFISHKTAQEFWIAIQPSLSTGGNCIITSTPNVQEGLFYELWKNSPFNGFESLKIIWDEHPERDLAWKLHTLKALPADKFKREFECEFI